MEAEYEPHQEREVLRVAARPNTEFWDAVLHSKRHEHDPIRASVSEAFASAPVSSLGSLERLPNELVSDICAYLDISSCFRFRQVNRRARQVVSARWEYRAVATHGLEGLRSVLRTRIASWFTISDLYRPLRQQECALCGLFSGFLFIPTMSRCCSKCVESPRAFGVVALSCLSKATKMSTHRLRLLLPVFRTVPGTYGTVPRTWTRPRYGVSEEQAARLLTTLDITYASRVLHYGAPFSCARYMVCTALPHLYRETNEVDNGYQCKGCAAHCRTTTNLTFDHVERAMMAYSRQGFLSHFQVCEPAKELWRASQRLLVESELN
ncbi:Uncharacterized protein TPAR_02565 [Tolypocladium paradoxum]|uniref:F-box domain-containing protein n=1 Tax=Tolypocladium paradoxum TaxID=94208 RepID=A0A2S4L478_9HYPO|nr:Uncharacterized protein TPAR_02565 [Tolypocladium paradoxum]